MTCFCYNNGNNYTNILLDKNNLNFDTIADIKHFIRSASKCVSNVHLKFRLIYVVFLYWMDQDWIFFSLILHHNYNRLGILSVQQCPVHVSIMEKHYDLLLPKKFGYVMILTEGHLCKYINKITGRKSAYVSSQYLS